MQALGTVDNSIFIEQEAQPEDEAPEIRGADYNDWLNSVGSFLSLDISARGTGWVMWKNKQLTWGRISLKADELVDRVEEFKADLLALISGCNFDYFFVEDVLGGVNFKTNRILFALNNIIDILIHEGKVLAPIQLFRESNVTWKRNLKGIAGQDFVIKSVDYTSGSDKEQTKACLEALGVNIAVLKGSEYTDKQVEDICDALGMALATIAVKIEKAPVVKNKILTTDIRKGYKIQQFVDYDSARKSAERCAKKKEREIIEYNLVDDAATDLIKYMAKRLPDNPEAVYLVHAPVSKCCNLLLLKRMETSLPAYYLTIRK